MRVVRNLMLSLSLFLVMLLLLFLIPTMVSPGPRERSEKLRREVREVCTALNISSQVASLQLAHIYADDTRRVLFCIVPKIASTTWKRVWLRLTSPSQTKPVAVSASYRHYIHYRSQQDLLIQPRFEDVWPDMLATYRKILFVRHPFKRIVSTYRDKIEFPTSKEDLLIPHFIKKIISEKYGALLTKADEVVSFAEFVRFIIDQKDEEIIPWDSHWRSVHQLCDPCSIEYDFIGKFESLSEDAGYVLRWLGVDDLVNNSLPAALKSTAADVVAHQYLRELSYPIKKSFLAKYRLDFLSFQYEFDLGQPE